MKTTLLGKAMLIGMLSVAPIVSSAMRPPQSDDKSAKQDVKDAGHSTKDAAKKTGKNIKKGTKKAVNKSAEKTAEGADKVRDKTKP